jgi:branched-chain amino acid transport system substrate-binding protein
MEASKRIGGFAVAALGLLLMGPPVAAQTAVKVGIIESLSGPDSSPGVIQDKAIKLYMKVHGKELPPGVKLNLITRDDTGPNPEVAKRVAQELVTRDHVNLLFGVIYSPNAVAIAPIATEAKVPLIVTNAAGSAITRASPYIVRDSFTIWQQSYPMGQWAAKQGWKKAYTAVTDYIPGYDGEAGFIKGFTEGGGQIVGSVRIPLADQDVTPYVQRIKDAQPDVVFNFVPGGTRSTAFMKAWHDLGLDKAGAKIVATQDLVIEDELPNMGDAPLGIVTAGNYSTAATRPQSQAYLAAWHKEYGDNDITNYVAVGAWDAMQMVFDLVNATKGKFTADQAMEFLRNWKTDKSPRGPISIDPKERDIVQNIYIRRVEKVNGKLANVEFDTIPAVKDPWKEFNPPK